MAFSDTVKRVLELESAIERYWDVTLRKRHPNYPIVGPGEDSPPPPPEEEVLRALLESLPPDGVYRILALDELGWGIAAPADLDALQRKAQTQYPDIDFVIDMLVETPSRVGFIPDAIEMLFAAGLDLDRLPVMHS